MHLGELCKLKSSEACRFLLKEFALATVVLALLISSSVRGPGPIIVELEVVL